MWDAPRLHVSFSACDKHHWSGQVGVYNTRADPEQLYNVLLELNELIVLKLGWMMAHHWCTGVDQLAGVMLLWLHQVHVSQDPTHILARLLAQRQINGSQQSSGSANSSKNQH